jgi:hypothetical protein
LYVKSPPPPTLRRAVYLGQYYDTPVLIIISQARKCIFVVIFIHASLRLRNVRNKLVNKMEVISLKRTPMGIFLEALGMEQELLS